jgi:hypothetical protein
MVIPPLFSAIIQALFGLYRERGIIGKNRADPHHDCITPGLEPVNTFKVLGTRNPDLPSLTGRDFAISTHRNVDNNIRAHNVPFLPALIFQPPDLSMENCPESGIFFKLIADAIKNE